MRDSVRVYVFLRIVCMLQCRSLVFWVVCVCVSVCVLWCVLYFVCCCCEPARACGESASLLMERSLSLALSCFWIC